MTSQGRPIRSDGYRPSAGAETAPSSVVRTRTAVLEHGRVTLKLRRPASGLNVVRRQRVRQQLQVLRFTLPDKDAVDRWLAHEPLRFEAPRLHLEIRRDVDELWDGAR